ncbi:MAG: hypothetical protein U9Q22_08235 [Candidatus Altiarchaeota archaeon]|nr:hypothetical protein [Candidatus Altiarchaeota archaeon]
MNSIKLLDKLKQKPVFRIMDVQKIINKNKRYSTLVVHRLKGRGLIKQITRNRYTTKDAIYPIASNLIYPSYISFWSASSLLGYTEQIPSTIQVVATRKLKSIEFEGYKIKFVKLPKQEFFGYRKIRIDNNPIFVAENEKLLIDVVNKQNECGNPAEIELIFQKTNVNTEKIVEYLKRVGKPALIKRVGYLLEKIKSIDLSSEFELNRNYIILNQFSKKWEKNNPKWRIKI